MTIQKNDIEEIAYFDSENGGHVSLGIDSNNYLYVNKKKILTTNIIKFDSWVNVSIILGGIGTLGIFLIELYKVLKIID